MRILTYNIWNYSGDWRQRRHLLVDVIKDLDPDVVALQEVRHSWADLPARNQALWLADRLGYVSVYRPANIFWPLPPVSEGLAFLSKKPLSLVQWFPVPRLPWSGPRRIILHGRFEGMDLYNVHFPLTDRGRIVEARQLADIVARTATGPAIALGDFNVDIDRPPMEILLEAGFVDLWTHLPARENQPNLWPDRRRIDYILGYGAGSWSGAISAVGKRHDGLRPSDHLGVLAELTRET